MFNMYLVDVVLGALAHGPRHYRDKYKRLDLVVTLILCVRCFHPPVRGGGTTLSNIFAGGLTN